MFADIADSRHVKFPTGPWLGKATNGFDPVRLNKGALQIANDVIFADFMQGKGTATEARIRPGRSDYNTDTLAQRYYMAEMEGSEATWTGGAQLLTAAKFGYASRRITHGGVATTDMYRTFAGKDITQGGLSPSASDYTLTLWMRASVAANVDTALSLVQLTSDAGPGAPAGWTDKRTATFAQLTGALVDATWVKFTIPLTTMTQGGTFNTASITGLNIRLVSTGAMTLDADEVFLETAKNVITCGLAEFLKPSTGERFLYAKNGESLYLDRNETKTFTKVVSQLNRNRRAYFAKAYNQLFMTDGDRMLAIDGTLSTLNTYNYRPIGFPAPPVNSITLTAVAAGTNTDVGAHRVWISYVYGSGAVRYGQSTAVLIGSVSTVANEQITAAVLPVPAESEGVVAKRIYMGLTDDVAGAPAYFVTEITATTTTVTFDLSDTTLSAITNPLAPKDNSVPTTALYMVPYEGTMVYLNLVGLPTGYAWSRKGFDINSGPEIVPAGNVGVSQLGEAWTGGFVRGRQLFAFTRRSIHEARYDQFGNLNMTELDQSIMGASVSVGAIDQSAIWGDEQGNVWFLSEQGRCVMEPGGRIRMVDKDRLYNEYKLVNDKSPTNSYDFRGYDSESDWDRGTAGANVASESSIEYQYPSTSTGAIALTYSYQTQNSALFLGASDVPYPFAPGDDPGPLNSARNRLNGSGSFWVLCQAARSMRIDGMSFRGYKGDNNSQTVGFYVHNYNYQFGRKTQFAFLDQTNIGGAIAAASAVHTGNERDEKIWEADFATPVYVPEGEFFWVRIVNQGGSVIFPVVTTAINNGAILANAVTASGGIVSGGGFTFDAGTVGRAPSMQVRYSALQPQATASVDIDAGATLQRWTTVQPQNDTGWESVFKRTITLQTSDTAGTFPSDWTQQVLWQDGYSYIGEPKTNKATAPMYRLGDFRPSDPDPTYQHRTQRRYARLTYAVEFDGGPKRRGYDVLHVDNSLVTVSEILSWGPKATTLVLPTATQASFASEPYPADVWTSDVVDLGGTPVFEWGRFNTSAFLGQQQISMQARTDSVTPLTTAWSDVLMDSIPSTTELPVNGRYMEIRFIFKDDHALSTELNSYVRSVFFSYRFSNDAQFVPILPPAGCFFDRYHLMAYAPVGQRMNFYAACISPGEKLSDWGNQTLTCFCIYDNRLLAGKHGSGKISLLWNNETQDDGVGVIAGQIITVPSTFGTPHVKTVQGIYVETGVREFKGIPTAANQLVPATFPRSSISADTFMVTLESGSTNNPVVGFAAPAAFAVQPTPYEDKAFGRYTRESHSTPLRVGVLGGDQFFFDLQRQDSVFVMRWYAVAHKIQNLGIVNTTYVNRFPYITDITVEAYLENFYGVQL